jgi:hypothetical protein
MPSTPALSTPLCRLIRQNSSPLKNTIIVDFTPYRATKASKAIANITNTPPPPLKITPNTRKRKIDFYSLYNYGFQGPLPALPKPSPLAKKSRIVALNAQELSQLSLSLIEEEVLNEDILEEQKKKANVARRRA